MPPTTLPLHLFDVKLHRVLNDVICGFLGADCGLAWLAQFETFEAREGCSLPLQVRISRLLALIFLKVFFLIDFSVPVDAVSTSHKSKQRCYCGSQDQEHLVVAGGLLGARECRPTRSTRHIPLFLELVKIDELHARYVRVRASGTLLAALWRLVTRSLGDDA